MSDRTQIIFRPHNKLIKLMNNLVSESSKYKDRSHFIELACEEKVKRENNG